MYEDTLILNNIRYTVKDLDNLPDDVRQKSFAVNQITPLRCLGKGVFKGGFMGFKHPPPRNFQIFF